MTADYSEYKAKDYVIPEDTGGYLYEFEDDQVYFTHQPSGVKYQMPPGADVDFIKSLMDNEPYVSNGYPEYPVGCYRGLPEEKKLEKAKEEISPDDYFLQWILEDDRVQAKKMTQELQRKALQDLSSIPGISCLLESPGSAGDPGPQGPLTDLNKEESAAVQNKQNDTFLKVMGELQDFFEIIAKNKPNQEEINRELDKEAEDIMAKARAYEQIVNPPVTIFGPGPNPLEEKLDRLLNYVGDMKASMQGMRSEMEAMKANHQLMVNKVRSIGNSVSTNLNNATAVINNVVRTLESHGKSMTSIKANAHTTMNQLSKFSANMLAQFENFKQDTVMNLQDVIVESIGDGQDLIRDDILAAFNKGGKILSDNQLVLQQQVISTAHGLFEALNTRVNTLEDFIEERHDELARDEEDSNSFSVEELVEGVIEGFLENFDSVRVLEADEEEYEDLDYDDEDLELEVSENQSTDVEDLADYLYYEGDYDSASDEDTEYELEVPENLSLEETPEPHVEHQIHWRNHQISCTKNGDAYYDSVLDQSFILLDGRFIPYTGQKCVYSNPSDTQKDEAYLGVMV